DVAKKHRIGADDQHAGAREQVTVGVEQVRRPVQRDRRLAGARTALYDEDTGRLRPDDPVLFGLDRLDDVAHPPGAAGRQRGQQRTLAAQRRLVVLGQRVEVEDVVLDVEQLPPAGAQMPSSYDAQRVGRGGPVE